MPLMFMIQKYIVSASVMCVSMSPRALLVYWLKFNSNWMRAFSSGEQVFKTWGRLQLSLVG